MIHITRILKSPITTLKEESIMKHSQTYTVVTSLITAFGLALASNAHADGPRKNPMQNKKLGPNQLQQSTQTSLSRETSMDVSGIMGPQQGAMGFQTPESAKIYDASSPYLAVKKSAESPRDVTSGRATQTGDAQLAQRGTQHVRDENGDPTTNSQSLSKNNPEIMGHMGGGNPE